MAIISIITPDQESLNDAIADVKGMLERKKNIWTAEAPLFENFDIMQEIDISPVQFGTAMCKLKMNRVKSALRQGINGRDDLDDSLLDLACYAILTRAIIKREQRTVKHTHSMSTDSGRNI